MLMMKKYEKQDEDGIIFYAYYKKTGILRTQTKGVLKRRTLTGET